MPQRIPVEKSRNRLATPYLFKTHIKRIFAVCIFLNNLIMKIHKLMMMMLVLLAATTAQAQVKAGSKGGTTETSPAEPTKNKPSANANQSAATTPEPADDPAKIKTADQCRAYAEAKVTWLEGQVGTLSSTQKKSIEDMFNQTYLEIKSVKEANPDMPKAELKVKAEEMLVTTRSNALEVLTPEQRAKMDSWQAENDPSLQDKAKERALEQTEELDAVVGLSADQKQQVLDLNTNLWKEGRAWKTDNPEATSEQKKAYAKEMATKRMEGYKTILTEEQKTKFMDYRKTQGGDME